jgi:hypothetical protein
MPGVLYAPAEAFDLGHQLGGIHRLWDVVAGNLTHAPHAISLLILAGKQ